MMAMMRRPPESALLGSHAAEPGQHKLEPARGLEGTMGEVTMETTGDAKLADQEKSCTQNEAGGIRLHHEQRISRGNMDGEKEEGSGAGIGSNDCSGHENTLTWVDAFREKARWL